MKLDSLLNRDFDTEKFINDLVKSKTEKFKNIKNLTYGPGEIVESVDLTNRSNDEAQRLMAELDQRITETIMNFNIEIQSA